MDTEQIEKLLRKTPAMKTPAGLLEKLTDDIRLPRAQSPMEWSAPPSWFKRWIPALSFATIFLTCLVAVAVQTNMIAELKRENAKLRAEQVNVEDLRTQNAELRRLSNENQELDRLRKDNLELARLREEVAQLRVQIRDVDSLRAQHAQLQAALAANSRNSATNETDIIGEEQAKEERIRCVNNLKQIGLAARVWSNDHNDIYPSDFISMTNELGNWHILHCISDKSRNITGWADVQAGNVSYPMDAPGIRDQDSQVVYAECPIHRLVLLVDGSVQLLSEKGYQDHIKIINGLKTFVPLAQP